MTPERKLSDLASVTAELHAAVTRRDELEAARDFLLAENARLRDAEERLRAEAQTEMPEEVSIEVLQPRGQPCQGCGITNKPLNRRFLCGGCLAIIGLTAENTRLRKELKEAHAARREAEEGLQQLHLAQAGVVGVGLHELLNGIKLLVWNLLAMTEACQNYIQTEVQPEFNAVVKPGGKSPHELRAEVEAERDSLRAELDRLRAKRSKMRRQA